MLAPVAGLLITVLTFAVPAFVSTNFESPTRNELFFIRTSWYLIVLPYWYLALARKPLTPEIVTENGFWLAYLPLHVPSKTLGSTLTYLPVFRLTF